MKQTYCMYICDSEEHGGPLCNEESTPATTYAEATKLARRDGWLIRPTRFNPIHLCHKHNALASDESRSG